MHENGNPIKEANGRFLENRGNHQLRGNILGLMPHLNCAEERHTDGLRIFKSIRYGKEVKSMAGRKEAKKLGLTDVEYDEILKYRENQTI